ncbi:MAG: DUF1801 domain-containing protein [Luteimonas sp.]
MKRGVAAASPDAYIAALDGWRRTQVEALRAAVRAAGALEERIKWGHLVYLHAGPVLLIRAEDTRVLFGFWRGARLREIEPRLQRGGTYEMATLTLREGDTLEPIIATRLAAAAIALNAQFGDPTATGR